MRIDVYSRWVAGDVVVSVFEKLVQFIIGG
jgi:hypothetical protein